MIQALPTDADCTVTVTGDITHQCPYRDEVDEGQVTLAWLCQGATIELHSLAAYLDAWKDCTVSHEQLVDRLALDLGTASPEVHLISVVARFTTAGMSVEVAGVVPGESLHAAGA